jgi:SAM-dependent methyltransferase
MAEELFDLSREYEQMLDQGIRLSGENQEFFIRGRLQSLRARLGSNFAPVRILDYGCGIGTTTQHLAVLFPGTQILGVDTSENALAYAAENYGSDRIRFAELAALENQGEFDLCYVNGVFHHIEPERRPGAVTGIHRALRRGGYLALFENNPWNPGARMVMSRIPFDRDAQMLSPWETTSLVRAGGFNGSLARWSLFYFPRPLAFLRFTEGALSHLLLGAQYCVLGTRQ